MRKYALPAALLGGLMSCSDLPTTSLPQQLPSPSSISRAVSHDPIPGQYIVSFRANGENALGNAAIVSNLYGARVDRVYSTVLNGAAMRLSDDAAAALRADPRVLSVEQDEVVRKDSWTQVGATWGLDRIDQRTRPLGGSYVYGADGSGVTVYIIDTGINFGQADFGGRAQTGYDAITTGGTAVDCEGHGSHVAGTVGSTTYGVAKNVRLVAVRVLNCLGSGSSSAVLAGIDWITTHKTLPAVVNMSIGAGVSIAVNSAVQRSIAAGITYVVSAGNASADACNQSPASAPDALTIGSSDSGDEWASFSNFGTCVDLLAPGVGITSWWTGSGSNTLSGTSMSSPHVAGAAALYLQLNPTATPAQVRAALVGNATAGTVTGVPSGTPNLLLYTGFIQGQSPAAPVANFTSSCTSVTCTFDAGSSTSSWATPTYQWTFGDATSGNGKTPTHTYATGGTYAVTLTITDPNGTSSKSANVVINRAPTAAIATPANNASFAQGASVTFSGTGTDPEDGTLSGASLVWTSSIDGQIGTGASVATTALSAGTHTIALTAKDALNATGTATRTIVITSTNPPPVARFTATCPTLQCTMDASGSTDNTGLLKKYTWSWGDGRIETKNQASVKNTWAAAGLYTVTLTVWDSAGVANTISKQVAVPDLAPVVTITAPANGTVFSLGAPVTFIGSATDFEDGALTGNALVWTSSLNGQIGTGVSFATTSLSAGTHTITLTAKDSRNATSVATRSITVMSPVNHAPVANFNMTCPTLTCTADASFSTDDIGVVSYSWDWGNGKANTVTTATTSTTFSAAGSYTVTLTVRDAGGLTSTTAKQVRVGNQSPSAIIASPANNASFMQGVAVTMSGSANDPEDGALAGTSLAWSSSRDGALGTGVSISTSTLSVGTHVISLVATDAQNAKDTATVTITIAANRAPSATIATPSNNATFLLGSTVSFSGAGSDPEDGPLSGAALVWTSSRDGQIGTGTSFASTTLSAGVHTITLTARDTKNATGTATVMVTVTVASNQAPTASIATPMNSATFGPGVSVSFSGSGTDPEDGTLSGAALVWSSSRDGQIGTGTTFARNNLSIGTHTITLTVKDAQNATAVATRVITVAGLNRPPVPQFTQSCTGRTCTFDASTSSDDTGIVQYLWTWGDGSPTSTSPSATASHTYGASGTYTVSLAVKDTRNSMQTIAKVVTVP